MADSSEKSNVMIEVTTEQLDQIKSEYKGSKYDWVWRDTIAKFDVQARTSKINGKDISYLSWGSDSDPYAFLCTKCASNFLMQACTYCGGQQLQIDKGQDITKLICNNCGNATVSWDCPKCNAKNMYPESTYWLAKRGCFIATKVYGSYNAQEVMILRKFRDDLLAQNIFGRAFVKIYYSISPAIAHFISNKKSMKDFIRKQLLNPLVNCLRKE